MRNKNRLNKLFTMLFASLLGIGLICSSTQASLSSFADELTCIDEDGDGYCDVCYKAMSDEVILTSGEIKTKHTHIGTGGQTYPNGCYDEAYVSREETGTEYYGENYYGNIYQKPDGSWASDGYCARCGTYGSCVGHPKYSRPIYSNITRYRCTKTTMNCGTADLIKAGTILKVKVRLDDGVQCVINSYSWKYNNVEISSSTSCEMTIVGKYTCVINYTTTDSSNRQTTAETVLEYGANVDTLARNVFYVNKTLKTNGYDLALITNPDYASYFTVVGYSWKAEETDGTWDILPKLPQKIQNNAGLFARDTFFTQNCGKFTCTVSYKGTDGQVLTKDIVYSLNDFDAKTASTIVSASTFSHKYQYFSQQNDYTQAEELTVSVNHGTKKIKDLSVRSFDETTHKINDTLQTTLPIKTYGNKSEVAVVDATFKITDLVNGTCTKEGTSTLVGKGTLKVGIRDDVTGEIFYTGQTYTLDKDQVSKVGMNILNHDCPIKSYTWKDSEHNDGVSDYIIIVRDCPAQGHNYEIWESLDGLHESHEDVNFDIKREITTHKTKDACQTVKTTVRYNRFEDEWVTYSVTEERKHPYESSLIPATCTETAKYHYECPFCGFVYEDDAAPELGHSYIWTIVKFMTAEEDGLMTGKCSRCGHETTRIMENPAKAKLGPRNVGADTDLPDIYIKSLLDASRATRPGIDLDLDGINSKKNGISLKPAGMGIGSYSGFGDGSGSNEAQYGIGYYEGRKTFLEKMRKILEDVLKAILNGIKHIIGFFKDHPVIAIILSIVIIAVIAALVYFFALRDRIKYKKAEKSKQ